MYVVGVAVVVAAGGAAFHGDHSDYSRYSDLAEKQKRLQEEENRRKIERKKKEINRQKEKLTAAVSEAVDAFKSDEILSKAFEKIQGNDTELKLKNKFAQSPNTFRNNMLKAVEEELEKSLSEDKERLADIDAAIMRINEVQLNCIKKK